MRGDDTRVITAAVSARFDTSALWSAHAAGAEGWHDVNRQTRDLPERIAELAGSALSSAADPEPAGTGCVLGSVFGTGHVAESIRQRLDAGARRSLDPASFLYFTAHGVTATVCLRHGLRGHCATLLGPASGLQAMATALRRIRLDADLPMLCGGYEVLSPSAAEALGCASTPAGAAAFLVLESARRARARGARVLGTVRDLKVVAREPSRPWVDPLASAPLAELAEALRCLGAGPPAVVVHAEGGRHTYTCTVEREG
ncbi:MAG: hypothetical protein ACRDRI_09715 [Pseudonocardiaceae bacterium]